MIMAGKSEQIGGFGIDFWSISALPQNKTFQPWFEESEWADPRRNRWYLTRIGQNLLESAKISQNWSESEWNRSELVRICRYRPVSF